MPSSVWLWVFNKLSPSGGRCFICDVHKAPWPETSSDNREVSRLVICYVAGLFTEELGNPMVPFSLFWIKGPLYRVTNPKTGMIFIIWLQGYQESHRPGGRLARKSGSWLQLWRVSILSSSRETLWACGTHSNRSQGQGTVLRLFCLSQEPKAPTNHSTKAALSQNLDRTSGGLPRGQMQLHRL